MNRQAMSHGFGYLWLALALAAWPFVATAQIAGAEIEEIEELPTISADELEELIGPIALYPDDLLAIVLPASAFPLQIVEAARFLEALETDPSLKPDPDWDDSVVALLNYPEVVALLNEDLDWTWRLGEAVVAQQADVIAAIELFRDRAYAAGNLKSDDYQIVAHKGSSIQITPVEEDVIYVPYYEPERVVVYQPRPVYFYYPRPYPVYYYPYPTYHAFHHNFFWGVTTAFSIGWHSHHLNVFHHSYFGHPYYGHHYWDRWWYRRPDIHVHNNVYVRNNAGVAYNRYRHGDRWQPTVRRTVRSSDQRVTRTRYYPNPESVSSAGSRSSRNENAFANTRSVRQASRSDGSQRSNRYVTDSTRKFRAEPQRPEIRFRERAGTPAAGTSNQRPARTTNVRRSSSRAEREQLQRRERTPIATTFRPSSQSANRQARADGSQQPQVRPSQVRRVEPGANRAQPRQSRDRQARPAQTRQPQVHKSQPRPKANYSKQSAPRQSKSASNQSRQSERSGRSTESRSSRRKR